ncbi:PKD domain-containing protein [uncultured Mucilaginibacter sp.]|uniref:PKD domain-containing protein n=1 Tax=uncultured Mucilaginibacter sp. TaxID=797541 RepID=UPI0025E20F3C|nr:PKD domain-containing protein [uncultured Mucilaginibacter sp.]
MGLGTYPKPVASFSVPDSVSCSGQLVLNVNNTTTGASSYTWIFGDGSPNGSGAIPVHTYTLPGTYTLQLIASNGTCPDTAKHIVKVANVPKASFAANVTNGCTILTTTFVNASVNASSYLWDFGDGTVSVLKTPTHTFSYVNAPYTIKLIAYGEFGCSDTIKVVKYITVAAPPTANFIVVPDSVIAIPNHSFQFNKITTGAGITNYNWDFGDGKTSTDSMPSHVYVDTGKYKVKLTVTNVAGCQAVRIRTVQITGIPLYLYVPNAFEPSSTKSELQTFNVRAFGLADYTLKVFNKWGQVIFQTNVLDANGIPTQGWDGMMAGAPAPQGVYVWEISAHFIDGTQWKGMKYNDGRPQSTVGIIHLIR